MGIGPVQYWRIEYNKRVYSEHLRSSTNCGNIFAICLNLLQLCLRPAGTKLQPVPICPQFSTYIHTSLPFFTLRSCRPKQGKKYYFTQNQIAFVNEKPTYDTISIELCSYGTKLHCKIETIVIVSDFPKKKKRTRDTSRWYIQHGQQPTYHQLVSLHMPLSVSRLRRG